MSMTDRYHDILRAFADVARRGVVRGRVGHGHRRLAAPDPRRRRPHQRVRRKDGHLPRRRNPSEERGRRSSGRHGRNKTGARLGGQKLDYLVSCVYAR